MHSLPVLLLFIPSIGISTINAASSSSCSNQLRVMAYNTWHAGSRVSEGVARMVKHIRLVDPDVVFLPVSKNSNVIFNFVNISHSRKWTALGASNFSWKFLTNRGMEQ